MLSGNFTVVFNELVSSFATGYVTLGGSAGATTVTVTGSGTTYQVAVTGMARSGTVTVAIAVDVALDASANGNAVSTSTDNSVSCSSPETVQSSGTIKAIMGGVADITSASSETSGWNIRSNFHRT